MSKIIFVCLKDEYVDKNTVQKVEKICDSLNPDNIDAHQTKINKENKLIVGISNPVQSITSKGVRVMFGQIFGEGKNWDEVNGFVPDGNYSIFRSNGEKVEILSDLLGTRSIWYYNDEKVFLASTSQRAIIQYLGNFKFNKRVIPWMLSNGLLGPGLGWDERISLLPPNSTLLLDRTNWELQVKSSKIVFRENKESDKEHLKKLHNVIESTFEKLNLDYSKWSLTLSGGYDSRGNLCFLPKKDKHDVTLRTLTWGLENSDKEKGTDAQVAKKIANLYDLEHTYFKTDKSDEPFDQVLDRFCRNGEGRIDHIGGYTDGFKIWKILFENDFSGVIRGDEVFGSYNFSSANHLKNFVGLSLCSDYINLKNDPFIQSMSQNFPQQFRQEKDESFEDWRDRLYQSYLVPIFLSALSDLKQPYLEQINPLLSKNIIMQIRKMPAHLRTDKIAFKKIVESVNPNIGFATRSSTRSVKNVMKQKEVVEIIKKELESKLAKSIFPEEFINSILTQVKTEKNRNNWHQSFLSSIKAIIPKKLKKGMKGKNSSLLMDFNLLAFRVFIIIRMVSIFEEDKKSLYQ